MAVPSWAVFTVASLVCISTGVLSEDHPVTDTKHPPSGTEHESPAASSVDQAVGEEEGRDTARQLTLMKSLVEFRSDIVLQIDSMMQEFLSWCSSKMHAYKA